MYDYFVFVNSLHYYILLGIYFEDKFNCKNLEIKSWESVWLYF